MVVTLASEFDPWDPYSYGPGEDAPGRRQRRPFKRTDALGVPLPLRALPVSLRRVNDEPLISDAVGSPEPEPTPKAAHRPVPDLFVSSREPAELPDDPHVPAETPAQAKSRRVRTFTRELRAAIGAGKLDRTKAPSRTREGRRLETVRAKARRDPDSLTSAEQVLLRAHPYRKPESRD